MTIRLRSRFLILWGLLLGLSACGADTPGEPDVEPEGPVASVSLDLTEAKLARGQQHQLVATVLDSAGRTITRPLDWSSSDPETVSVDSAGRVTAHQEGVATITGSLEGFSDTSTVTVVGFNTIAAGPTETCALTLGGRLYCAGADYGDRGAAPFGPELPFAMLTIGGLFGPGATHACALTGEGAAYCWGNNTSGQLGTGDTQRGSEPAPVAGDHRFQTIVAGGSHTCALTLDHQAFCWGDGTQGQLGSATGGSLLPVAVETSVRFTALEAGRRHTCALTAEGRGYCWGDNELGELGRGGAWGTGSAMPMAVAGDHLFEMLGSRATHVCGLRQDGRVYCWGDNTLGQLGTTTSRRCRGDKPCSTEPVLAAGGRTFAHVFGSPYTTCVLTTGAAVYCWGFDLFGKMGAGIDAVPACPVPGAPAGSGCTPDPVAGPTAFRTLSGADSHFCGMRLDGVALCWGSNDHGQLGDPAAPESFVAPRPFGIDPAS